MSSRTGCDTGAQTAKPWGLLHDSGGTAASQHLCQLGPRVCVGRCRPVASWLVSLVLKCWELTPLWWGSVTQPAFKDAMVKLRNKQQPPYLGEEDDGFFPITN